MEKRVDIIGGGLAGSEAALQLAADGFAVRLIEMRPFRTTGAHHGDKCAELVCSNSLKSTKEASAAGMLKAELELLGSHLLAFAHESSVPAGGALAVDREQFASLVTDALVQAGVARIEAEVVGIDPSARSSSKMRTMRGHIFLRTRHRSASSLRALLLRLRSQNRCVRSPGKTIFPSMTLRRRSSMRIRSTMMSCSARAATKKA